MLLWCSAYLQDAIDTLYVADYAITICVQVDESTEDIS